MDQSLPFLLRSFALMDNFYHVLSPSATLFSSAQQRLVFYTIVKNPLIELYHIYCSASNASLHLGIENKQKFFVAAGFRLRYFD